MPALHEEIKSAIKFGTPIPAIPEYMLTNIKYELFSWQKESLGYFLLNEKKKRDEAEPTHLMFNMATGTGKTLVMAATVLYYFKQGYRHFIFFVNQNNIVDKTENNFIDSMHNKYLFKEKIVIDDKTVIIKKVENFSNNPQGIEIKFTTIQKLYNDIHLERENRTTLNDLHKKNIVMLADEAHHLNTNTKNIVIQDELSGTELKGTKEEKEKKGWEHTVIELILKKNGKSGNKNILLEFTATIPEIAQVLEKYEDKIIYKFDLKAFLQAGYTKEINLVSSSFDKKQRILQALLFNWYRHEIALNNGLINFKPVILFRSKYIDKSDGNNSEADYKYFKDLIKNLSLDDFDFLIELKEKEEELANITETYKKGKSRIIDIQRYIEDKSNNVSLKNIITYLKSHFQERHCIITNSKSGTKTIEKTDEKTDKRLNSLENKNNHIRAIFTVKKLTEGWDVLNLYDIVRLYKGRDEGATVTGERRAGKTTVSEVQLIGRGIRYYPFPFEDHEVNKRKFDNNLDHEMRVLEEFYFHSDSDPKYISELIGELKKQDLLPQKDKVIQKFQLELNLDQAAFFEEIQLYKNEPLPNPKRRKKTLDEIRKDFELTHEIKRFNITETSVNMENEESQDVERLRVDEIERTTLSLRLIDFDRHIIHKAINIHAQKDDSILRFDRLKDELHISSIHDALKDKFLGNFSIKLIVPKWIKTLEQVSNNDKLNLLVVFFGKIAMELKNISNPSIGSDFNSIPFNEMDWIKVKSVVKEPESEYLNNELKKKNWYVLNHYHGTSEEDELIKFLMDTMGNFEAKYEKVYLLRNEEVYKIYDFEKGRGFQPDFLLFLKAKKKQMFYQVFIEPKGSQFKDSEDGFRNSKEGWKEVFLEQILEKYGNKKILKVENRNYKLIGLPLYNHSNSSGFKNSMNENLNISI